MIDPKKLRELLAAEPARWPWRPGSVETDRVYCPFDGLGPERVVLRTNGAFRGRTAELVAAAINALPELLDVLEAAAAWRIARCGRHPTCDEAAGEHDAECLVAITEHLLRRAIDRATAATAADEGAADR